MSAPNSPNQYIPLGERASSVPPHPQLAERSPVATPQPTDRNLEEPDEVDDAMDRDGGGDDDNDSNYVDEEAMLEEAAETLGFRVAVRRHSQQDLLDMADFLLTFIYLYTFLVDKSIVNAMVRYVASITAMYPRTNYGVGVALSVMALANSLSIARHISMGLSQHGFDATGALVDFIGCSSPHLVLVLLVDLFALFIEFVRVFAYSPMHFAKARTARVLALILAAERADDIVSALAEQIGEGSGSDTATPEQMAAATGNEDDQVVLSIDSGSPPQQGDYISSPSALVFTVFAVSRASIVACVQLDSELRRRFAEASQQEDPPEDSPSTVAGIAVTTRERASSS